MINDFVQMAERLEQTSMSTCSVPSLFEPISGCERHILNLSLYDFRKRSRINVFMEKCNSRKDLTSLLGWQGKEWLRGQSRI